MLTEAKKRVQALQSLMQDQDISVAVFTDQSSIAYLAGFWGYLGIEFGRPTCLVVYPDKEPVVITPFMESEMVAAMTWVEDVHVWHDSGPNSWGAVLAKALGVDAKSKGGQIWIEQGTIPAIIRNFFDETYLDATLSDISPILASLRVIKSPLEIDIMRKAGEIGGAMMKAAEQSLKEGAPEYESALAIMAAGTRASAGFLTGQ